MRPTRAVIASATFIMAACTSAAVVGSPATMAVDANAADWPSYNRTLDGDRYSPLAEIDRTNVAQLRLACTYTLPEVTSLQTGPIVVAGTMYFTTDTITYAIDGASCAEKWKQVRHSPTPSALAVNRGAVYLDGRLYRGTSDAHVLALDATDGHTIWEHEIDAKAAGVTIPMAPIAANGLVFVGNAGGDLVGRTGHVYALDGRDGHVVWSFDDDAEQAARQRDVAQRSARPDLRGRVLDVVHLRCGERHPVRAGGQSGAGLRHRPAPGRQSLHQLGHRARREERPHAGLQPARQATTPTTGTSTARQRSSVPPRGG